MTTWRSKLYHGRVEHTRLRPKKHALTYRVCSFLFDLNELDALHNSMWFFSFNKWNILSFYNKDFGNGTHNNLHDYVEEALTKANIPINLGRVELLCYPRILGYAFNPLCVYFCYDDTENLKVIIYEVNNTFKQRHSYMIEVPTDQQEAVHQVCTKELYVSPFMGMDAVYYFSIKRPQERVSVKIDQHDQDGLILTAIFTGKAEEFSNLSTIKMFFKYPLMTLKVTLGIHWEALHLWRKGVKLVKRPEPPKELITHITFPLHKQERFSNE